MSLPIQFFEKPGRGLDRFTGELVHKKAFSRKYFANFEVSHRPFYWKNHPDHALHIIYGFRPKN